MTSNDVLLRLAEMDAAISESEYREAKEDQNTAGIATVVCAAIGTAGVVGAALVHGGFSAIAAVFFLAAAFSGVGYLDKSDRTAIARRSYYIDKKRYENQKEQVSF
ncbi:hypothetical protein ACFXG4_23540 [Nocardia sp. NPDC059246]|uniref:hypothetical protein n=1 Tax=unclassified Nocardia TaxID=2637762 RepID=UPI003678D59E